MQLLWFSFGFVSRSERVFQSQPSWRRGAAMLPGCVLRVWFSADLSLGGVAFYM